MSKAYPYLAHFFKVGEKSAMEKNKADGKFLPSINQIAYSILLRVNKNLVWLDDHNSGQYCACVYVLIYFCVKK